MKSLITTFLLIFFAAACGTTQKADRRGASTGPVQNPRFEKTVDASVFYKGNLHTHTNLTDGDSSPESVLNWYKKQGYHFVAITDHDTLTKTPDGIVNENFVTLNGVEITALAARRTPVHVNAICGESRLVGPRLNKAPLETLDLALNLSRGDGAISLVNHPNFGWALSSNDLLAAGEFELLEIASGHPSVHERGDAKRPSAVALWDTHLTQRGPVYGTAVDDSHYFKGIRERPRVTGYRKRAPHPGRAWVQVWAPTLSPEDVCDSIRQGHFYSAKNWFDGHQQFIQLRSLKVANDTIEISVANWKKSTDQVSFIGANGKVLKTTSENPAGYTLKGDEGYVRAHVEQRLKRGKSEAWTQAYYVTGDEK